MLDKELLPSYKELGDMVSPAQKSVEGWSGPNYFNGYTGRWQNFSENVAILPEHMNRDHEVLTEWLSISRGPIHTSDVLQQKRQVWMFTWTTCSVLSRSEPPSRDKGDRQFAGL